MMMTWGGGASVAPGAVASLGRSLWPLPACGGGEAGLPGRLLGVITVMYLGTALEQGSSCFLLELIFCPTFIS